MKFDVVIGNPPYQENDNGKRKDGTISSSAKPLYNKFFELSKCMTKDKISLIFPARWLSGAGKGLQKFTNEMINDKHIKSLTLYRDARKVFPDNDIKGGVLYLTYDKSYNGKADIEVIDKDGTFNQYDGYLNSDETGIFIPYKELLSIFRKVIREESIYVDSLSSSRKPYGLPTNFFNNMDSTLSKVRLHDDDIEIIGLLKGKRVKRYVDKDFSFKTGMDSIHKWKLFAGKAMGSGVYGEKLPDLPIGKPGVVSTETFIKIGDFDTQFQVESVKKYFYTKFFRAMLGIIKTTQDASARVYRFVPVQDFSEHSDIDWNKSINEIDKQLFRKYNLSDNEIKFIENRIQAMGD